MAESSFEATFTRGARAYYDGLPASDRAEIDSIREAIESDPGEDGQLKVAADVPTVMVYLDDRWTVLYEITEPGHIVIDGIAPAGQSRWWLPR